MGMYVKVAGVWKEVTRISRKVGGTWKDVGPCYVKDGTWKKWFGITPLLTRGNGDIGSVIIFTGFSDNAWGQFTSAFGDLSNKTWRGETIDSVMTSDAAVGELYFVIAGTGHDQDLFYSLETSISGLVFSADATHYEDGGQTWWYWNNVGSPFPGSGTETIVIS